ncbi:MAG TPA: hypothetical protein VGL77_05470 [Armatimonadota bacterium]
MRYLGLFLGGLFLTDGLLSIIGRKDLVERLNRSVGKRLPDPVNKTLKKATDVNDTALTALGINNLIAGAGMVLVSSLVGLGRTRAR